MRPLAALRGVLAKPSAVQSSDRNPPQGVLTCHIADHLRLDPHCDAATIIGGQ